MRCTESSVISSAIVVCDLRSSRVIKMPLSEQALNQIRALIGKYPVKKSALIPALHIAQHDCGWLTPEVVEELAEELDLTPTQVHSVGSFYSLFYFKPRGKYEVQICANLACMLYGAEKLSEHVCGKLGVKPGETTVDGKFTVIHAECLAACGGAPCIWVEGEYFENVTPEKADEILDKYAKGGATTEKS